LRKHGNVLGLASVAFLSRLAHEALPSVFVLYAGYRYQWKEMAVGLVLAVVGVTSAIVQGGLIGPFIKRFGENKSLLIGMLFGVLGFAIFGFAPKGYWFFFGIPLMAMWGVAGPSIQSLISRQVGPKDQGFLQGSLNSLYGVADMGGPLLFSLVFGFFIGAKTFWHQPGAPFLVASVVLFAGFLLALKYTTGKTKSLRVAARPRV